MDINLNITNNLAEIKISSISGQRAMEILAQLQGDSINQFSEKEVNYVKLYKDGEQLQAIKDCKEQTGWGLKEAKDHVEALVEKWNKIYA